MWVLHHLTQLTGCTPPAAGTHTVPVGLVAERSVLTQAAMQTVCAIKPRGAFWERKMHRETHPSVTC